MAQTTHPLPGGTPAVPVALEPVVAFAGPLGGHGDIEVYDAGTGGLLAGPSRLTGVRLLPLDFTGRTQFEELDATRPQRRADLPGDAARIILPGRRGSLYRYERVTGGPRRFGFLLVPPRAFPRVLFELDGTGAQGNGEPFLGTVGIDADGTSFLVATTPAAGGDLYEVSVLRSIPELRTAFVAPLAFEPDGLWLGDGFGFGVSKRGILRFPRAAGGLATPVPAPPGTVWTGQATMAPNRRTAIATSGVDPAQRHVWVFGAGGAGLRVSSAAAEIADAGYLPAYTSGPWMAVSDDGAFAAWIERTELPTGPVTSFRDVRITEVALPSMSTVVTGDNLLLDTLDEVGKVGFSFSNTLVYAAGEWNDPAEGGLGTADFFAATLTPGQPPQLRNLSLTSGQPFAPFLVGVPTLTPVKTYLVGDRILVHDDDGEELVTIDRVNGGLQVLEGDVKELQWAELVDDALVVALRRRSGQRPTQVLRFDADLSGGGRAVLDPGSDIHTFLHPVVDGGAIGWIQSVLGSQHVERAWPATLAVESWASAPFVYQPPLAMSRTGDLRFARVAMGAGVEERIWRATGGDVPLLHPLRPGHWLP